MRRMERWRYAVAIKRVHRAWVVVACFACLVGLPLILLHVSLAVGTWGRGPRMEGSDADGAHHQVAGEDQLSIHSICPTLVARMASQPQTRSVFVGDSTALQVMRVSALCLSTCLRSASLMDEVSLDAVASAIGSLNKRISEVGDVERIDVAMLNGSLWEFRFVKARYLATVAAVDWLQREGNDRQWSNGTRCAAAHGLELFVMAGAWDMIRPSVRHDGLALDDATTSTPSAWRGALVQYAKTVATHAASIAGRVGGLRAWCPNVSVVVALPLLPNCSAPKFLLRTDAATDRGVVGSREPVPTDDPYRFVRGASACHARLLHGTGAVLRKAMLQSVVMRGARVIDVEPLVHTTQPVGQRTSTCTKSDGTHFDDLSATPLRLTRCGLEVVRCLWTDARGRRSSRSDA